MAGRPAFSLEDIVYVPKVELIFAGKIDSVRRPRVYPGDLVSYPALPGAGESAGQGRVETLFFDPGQRAWRAYVRAEGSAGHETQGTPFGPICLSDLKLVESSEGEMEFVPGQQYWVLVEYPLGRTQVLANRILSVAFPNLFPEKPESYEIAVTGEVLAQDSLAKNPRVYLANPFHSEIYRISGSELRKAARHEGF